MPVKLTIGGEVYETAIMNLDTLEIALDVIADFQTIGIGTAAGEVAPSMDQAKKVIGLTKRLVECALAGNEDAAKRLTEAQLGQKLKAPELKPLQAAVREIMAENDLQSGEAKASAPTAGSAPNRKSRRAASSTASSSET